MCQGRRVGDGEAVGGAVEGVLYLEEVVQCAAMGEAGSMRLFLQKSIYISWQSEEC